FMSAAGANCSTSLCFVAVSNSGASFSSACFMPLVLRTWMSAALVPPHAANSRTTVKHFGQDRQPLFMDSPCSIFQPQSSVIRSFGDSDGRPIRQYLRRPLNEFGSVIAHSDHGIGADLLRVLDHAPEGFVSRLFADLLIFRNVSAEHGFETAGHPGDDACCAHNEA